MNRVFTKQEIRFVSDNLNISPVSLGKFLHASRYQVDIIKAKILKAGKAKVQFNCGFSYLYFHSDKLTYQVSRRLGGVLKTIGSCVDFTSAVEILDKYLLEVEQGFIEL